MGWFTEQIRQRAENDQNVLEDSFFRMASVVMDKWDANRLEDKRQIAKEAIDDILRFYHQKPVEIPEQIKDVNDQLEYVLRPTGLMTREVEVVIRQFQRCIINCISCQNLWVLVHSIRKAVLR